jgi:hypothetical protein
MVPRYWWEDENARPVPGIDSRSHEGRAYYNWCLSQRPTARPLNAVERLLAHAQATSDFFEEMFGYKHCRAKWSAAECLEDLVRQFVSFSEYDAERIREYSRKWNLRPFAMSPTAEAIRVRSIEDHWKEFPQLAALLDTERPRLPLLVRWPSADFLHHAVQQTVLEGAAVGRDHGSGHDLTPEGISRYLALLATRQSLISDETLAPLIADVVAEAESRWPNTAALVIQRAEHAADAIRGLSAVCAGKQWKAANAKRMVPAIRALQRFTNPQSPVASNATATENTKPKKRQNRARLGGTTSKYPTGLFREARRAWNQYLKDRRLVGGPLQKQSLWLYDDWLPRWCEKKGLIIEEVLPELVAGETWEKRADRFWLAERQSRRNRKRDKT